MKQDNWADKLNDKIRSMDISLFTYVPDAGHSAMINRALADPDVTSVPLAAEEEGVSLLAGAHLGGSRGVLLLQSSGVGNCINMLSLTNIGRFPLVSIVSMRGDYGEQNPWQFPMGQGTQACLEAMGTICLRVETPDDVVPAIEAAVNMAYRSDQSVALLLSQRLIGAKPF
ncbi:MAG: phosphonopyruvate decarboxylase [Pseudomonadota bacterium]|nr:phosphonopyruvate decarboxylase [Pseudomonadota bacterium]